MSLVRCTKLVQVEVLPHCAQLPVAYYLHNDYGNSKGANSYMAKKKLTRKKHFSANDTHILLRKSVVVYAFIVFILFILVSLSAYTIYNISVAYTNKSRLDRIERIYNSLKLGDEYRVAKSDVFGDKRIYSWDESRTYASTVEYGHNDTTANTFADLTTKLKAAGFSQFEDIYGGMARQLHFKNTQNEYVRVSVVPKDWQDTIIYGTATPNDMPATLENPSSASPVYVTIKVNLDDNNE